MAPDYRMYLAENVINEQRVISYRTLSRAMGVHVNQAKRMLYDFYERENGKKNGSVHAMYLLAGKKKSGDMSMLNGNSQNNGHTNSHPSSPPMSSSMPEAAEESVQIPIKTFTLVREEDLDEVKASYESITAIHIYSLEAGRIEDLQTLSDVGREIFSSSFVKEDPLENYKKYGIIQNRHVKRRTGIKPPLPPAPTPSEKAAAVKASAATPVSKAQPTQTSNAGPFAKSSTLKRTDSQDSNRSTSGGPSSTTKPATLKRDSSSIFKSFAKAKPKAENKESAGDGDTALKETHFDNDDEDEEEEHTMFLDAGKNSKSSSKAQEDREERARKLRKMMEDSDAEEDNVQTDLIDLKEKEGQVTTQETTKKPTSSKPNAEAKTKMEEEEGREWPSSPEPETRSKPETEVADQGQGEPASAPAGQASRRRGRRKVMKKRTMKDEEGYLVTKEEAVWESFSEDEEKPAASKSATQPKPKSAAAGGKPAAGKGGKGGGDIMSFFSKK